MKRSFVTVLAAVALGVSAAAPARTAALLDPDTWAVAGTLSDACQCNVFCPCELAEKPTYGHCDDTAILHVTTGHYGSVPLDGLRVVVVSQSPKGERLVDTIGNLVFARLYVPEGATDAQAQALAELARHVFGTWVSGKVARISPNESIHKVAMTAVIEPHHHRVEIPGVLDLDIRALTGWDGENPVALRNGPAAGPGIGDILIAKSDSYHFTDGGIDWNYAGRSASMRTLDLSGSVHEEPKEPEPAEAPARAHHHHHDH
jgi:hypothetical protein